MDDAEDPWPEAVLASARRVLAEPGLAVVDRLGGSDRSLVLRVGTGDRRWIVKAHGDRQATWLRECAALAAADGSGVTPSYLGEADDPRLVVMGDAGAGTNVADALLGADPTDASDALADWGRALARLHLDAERAVPTFVGRLRPVGVDARTNPEATAVLLGRAAECWQRQGSELGVPVDDALADRIATLPDRFADRTEVLSPGDTCPDNNVRTPAGLVLIDLEFAVVQHPAWDLAYVRSPWPSCWCAWAVPGAVADRAVAAYRTVRPPADPAVFDHDLALADLGQCLLASGLRLEYALPAESPDPGPGGLERRMQILQWLGHAATLDVDPGLADLAGRLHAALQDRWGARPLPYAAAFGSAWG